MKKYKISEKNVTIIKIHMILICLLLALSSCAGETETENETQFDENGLFVSDALSYEELQKYYSQDRDVSLNDAEGKLAQMGITEDEAGTYRVVAQKIEGSEKYTPVIKFYLKTDAAEGSYTIEQIQKAELSITANQEEAVFLGGLTYWLRENQKIEYSLQGDLYEAATQLSKKM